MSSNMSYDVGWVQKEARSYVDTKKLVSKLMAVVKDEAERGNEALTASAQASVQFKRCTHLICAPATFHFCF